MSRRTIVLAVLLLFALVPGAWFVLGPTRPAPVAAPPPIDVETPAGRARLDAALALARMPDDPWTLAESIPVAPSASDPTGAKSNCGEDQAQRVEATPDADGVIRNAAVETRAAGVGYTGATRRIDAALRASGDPFDGSVADALNIGDVLTSIGRLEALVQDAVASGDPRIYGLAFEACNGMVGSSAPAGFASCAQLNVQEWVRRDPGNAAPWIDALQRANESGDQVAQQEAMRQIASSSRFETYFGAASAAVARLQIASDADLYAQSILSMQAAVLYRNPPFQAVTSRCRDGAAGDKDRAAVCESVGEVLFDHADTLLTRAIGGSIHRLATGDPSRLDQAHREQRAFAEHWKPATGFSPCKDEREVLKSFVRVGTIGELAMLKEDLRTPMPP